MTDGGAAPEIGSGLTVAAAQIECRPGDIASNLELHRAVIETARAASVDLLLFPELSLTDYLSIPDVEALARSPDAREVMDLAQAAGPMAVSIGFIERGRDGRVYNSQALLSDGRCLHVHRKVNLPTYGRLQETRHYAPGRRIEPVRWHGWTLATLTCADLWNPALAWLAALQGVDLLLVPVASSTDAVDGGFDNPGGWDTVLRQTALVYGVPVVMANHTGKRGGLSFWGGSRVIDAFGREQARLGPDTGLAIAHLGAADGEAARTRLPTMRDATPDVVNVELERILRSRPF